MSKKTEACGSLESVAKSKSRVKRFEAANKAGENKRLALTHASNQPGDVPAMPIGMGLGQMMGAGPMMSGRKRRRKRSFGPTSK